jgi:hypothetical protein
MPVGSRSTATTKVTPAQDLLVVGAEERREIPGGPRSASATFRLALNVGFLDLVLSEVLVRLIALGRELAPVAALVGGKLHCRGAALGSGFVHSCFYLRNPAIVVRHHVGLNRDPGFDIGSGRHRSLTLDLVADMSLGEKTVAADSIRSHQDDQPGRPGRSEVPGCASVVAKPSHCGQLAQLQRRVKPFGEPPLNRSKQFARWLRLTLVAPEPRHAHRGAQFPGLCLFTSSRKRALEIHFRFRHGGLADIDAKPKEFAVDAGSAP